MPHTNPEIDEAACAEIMRRYQLTSKNEAINLALRKVATEPAPAQPSPRKPMSIAEALAMEGTGWDGDLNAMRSARLP